MWGSDNFIHVVSDGLIVGILNFHFDETTLNASLLAAAWDFDGLTFTNGVEAIQLALVPEPSAFAAIAGIFACGLAVLRRRYRS